MIKHPGIDKELYFCSFFDIQIEGPQTHLLNRFRNYPKFGSLQIKSELLSFNLRNDLILSQKIKHIVCDMYTHLEYQRTFVDPDIL